MPPSTTGSRYARSAIKAALAVGLLALFLNQGAERAAAAPPASVTTLPSEIWWVPWRLAKDDCCEAGSEIRIASATLPVRAKAHYTLVDEDGVIGEIEIIGEGDTKEVFRDGATGHVARAKVVSGGRKHAGHTVALAPVLAAASPALVDADSGSCPASDPVSRVGRSRVFVVDVDGDKRPDFAACWRRPQIADADHEWALWKRDGKAWKMLESTAGYEHD